MRIKREYGIQLLNILPIFLSLVGKIFASIINGGKIPLQQWLERRERMIKE